MKILKITTTLLLLSLCSLAWADVQCPATEGGRSFKNARILQGQLYCYYNYYNGKAYTRVISVNNTTISNKYAADHPNIWKGYDDRTFGRYYDCRIYSTQSCKIPGVSKIHVVIQTRCKDGTVSC